MCFRVPLGLIKTKWIIEEKYETNILILPRQNNKLWIIKETTGIEWNISIEKLSNIPETQKASKKPYWRIQKCRFRSEKIK